MDSVGIAIGAPGAAVIYWRLAASLASRRRAKHTTPTPWQVRWDAYRRFENHALIASLNVQLIVTLGAPPPLLGAMWTWPAVIRAQRAIIDSSQESILALVEIATVGTEVVLDEALKVASSVGDLLEAYQPVRRRSAPPDAFARGVDAVNQAVLDYVDVTRADLQKHDKS